MPASKVAGFPPLIVVTTPLNVRMVGLDQAFFALDSSLGVSRVVNPSSEWWGGGQFMRHEAISLQMTDWGNGLLARSVRHIGIDRIPARRTPG